MCAVLVKEPFNLPIEKIERLTPYQVRHIYFRDTDRDRESVKPQKIDPFEFFREQLARKGYTSVEIQRIWRARQAKHKKPK